MPKPQRTKKTSKTHTKAARNAAAQHRVATPRGKMKAAAATKSAATKSAKSTRVAKAAPSSKRAGAPKGRTTMARTKSPAKAKVTTKAESATKKRPRALAKPATATRGARAKTAQPAKLVKTAAKKSTPTRAVSTAKAKNGQGKAPRRDATGHLNPRYARDLRAISREGRENDGEDRAFFRTSRSGDDLAEELGEEAVATMTTGEDQSERFDKEVDEERGGPFIKTRSKDEFARGTDRSNPRGATREPFPRT